MKNIKNIEENPFKFGSVVSGDFFTDREKETAYVKTILASRNHLVLIAPRRFGKTSLVQKAAAETGRTVVYLNFDAITSKQDLAEALLRRVFSLSSVEKFKHLLRNFRFVPKISMNPINSGVDFEFVPSVDDKILLEDAFDLLEKLGTESNRLIVIFDEFQRVVKISEDLSGILRSIMQEQKHINYILLGSQESMMTDIFEKKKSPFYHFGTMMTLSKIPREEFAAFLDSRLPDGLSSDILDFTDCHPYYTQKLAFHVWNLLKMGTNQDGVVEAAIEFANQMHSLDFERLWDGFNNTDRKILKALAGDRNLNSINIPASTLNSALKKMTREGFLLKGNAYRIEDPFFSRWIFDCTR